MISKGVCDILQAMETSSLSIKINDKVVSDSQPVFIIAEAGVNHNGNFETAKKMVLATKTAGADAIKFQTFKTENLVLKDTALAQYQKENINKESNLFEELKKLELSSEQFIELKKICDQEDIIFLSTPHTDDAIDQLDEIMPAFKVASVDITNLPF